MKTLKENEIRIVPIKSRKVYKIYKQGSMYQTFKLHIQEFNDMEYFTENDWKNYLNTSGNYFKIK